MVRSCFDNVLPAARMDRAWAYDLSAVGADIDAWCNASAITDVAPFGSAIDDVPSTGAGFETPGLRQAVFIVLKPEVPAMPCAMGPFAGMPESLVKLVYRLIG